MRESPAPAPEPSSESAKDLTSRSAKAVSIGPSDEVYFNDGMLVANAGAISCKTQEAAQAGLQMLKAGGNAVDAIVATGLAMSVVSTGGNSLGGYGGAMVIKMHDQAEPEVIDFATRAPLAARADMFDSREAIQGHSILTVTTWNAIAGLYIALERHGSKSWRDVFIHLMTFEARACGRLDIQQECHGIHKPVDRVNLAAHAHTDGCQGRCTVAAPCLEPQHSSYRVRICGSAARTRACQGICESHGKFACSMVRWPALKVLGTEKARVSRLHNPRCERIVRFAMRCRTTARCSIPSISTSALHSGLLGLAPAPNGASA